MSEIYSQRIYSSDTFNISVKYGSLIIEFNVDNNLIISSWLNGGYQENITSVVNQSVEGDDYQILESVSYPDFQKLSFEKLGLDPLTSTGLITSACMDNYAISTKKYKQLEVTALVTAGADKNGTKAGDPASFYEYNNKYVQVGTINIFLMINANLEKGSLVTALITATEAKTSVLQDLKLESQYSTCIATGTGTDGICVVSNKSSSNNIENAGKHSKLGELIAKTVQEATRKALYFQTWMSEEYQKTVLSRLSRFNIDFDNLYENSGIDKLEYATKFYLFNNNSNNISWISMIINLIDEVQNNLMTIDDITPCIKQVTKTCMDIDIDYDINSIGDILEYIIIVINKKIIKEG